MAISRTPALLLKRTPFSESSLVVHLLCEQAGRVHVLAKGAYRPTSGYFAVLDFFDTLDVELWQSRRGELDLLRKADLVVRRHRISADLGRYRAAAAMVELAEMAAQQRQGDPALYRLLEQGLDDLCSEQANPELALVLFELRFLEVLGLAPELQRCVSCERAAPAPTARPRRIAFSAALGGRLCEACATQAKAGGARVGTLPQALVESVRGFQRVRYEDGLDTLGSGALAITPKRLKQARVFTLRFLGYHLEVLPRSQRAFLAHAQSNAQPD